jgi:hypothetical protein
LLQNFLSFFEEQATGGHLPLMKSCVCCLSFSGTTSVYRILGKFRAAVITSISGETKLLESLA